MADTNANEQVKPPVQNETPAAVDPLAGKVHEKGYSTTNVQVAPENLARPIPEAGFVPPPPNAPRVEEHPFADEMKQQQQGNTQTGQQAKPKPPEQFSQDIGSLPPKEKAEAAERAAETALRAYGTMHVWANKWLQISDRKIFKLQTKKEIDLAIPIPYENGKDIPLGQFIKEYNRQVADTLTVDPEWRAEVKPILARVLAKHGHGISDEYQLGYLVMEDLAGKIGMFSAMKRQTADVMEFAKSQTAELNKAKQPQAVVVQPPQQAQPEPQSAPVQQQPAQPMQHAQPIQQSAQANLQPQSNIVQQNPPQAQRDEHTENKTPLQIQNEHTGTNHPVDHSPRAQEASALADNVHAQTQMSHIPAEQRETAPVVTTPAASGDIHIAGNARDKFIKESQPIINPSGEDVPAPAAEKNEAAPIPESTVSAEGFPQEIITGKKERPKKTAAPKKSTVKKKR